MSKTKEREAEKSSSKSATKISAKAPVGKAATTKAQSQPAKAQSQPVKAQAQPVKAQSQPLKTQAPASKTGKSSAKLPAAKADKGHSEREKVVKSDKSERLDKHDKVERTEKAEKTEKSGKSERLEKAEKSDRSERSERASERHERLLSEKAAAVPALPTKSPFPKDELGKWRVQLLSRRNEISTDIAGLEKDAMEAEDGHTTPNHLAERGSDADLQDVSLGIAGEEKDIIWQIDRALRKIDESQPIPFGLCEYTKEAIPRSRLALIPWTPLSIEGATHMEEKGLMVEDMLVDG